MILPDYKNYYDRLLEQSERFVVYHSKLKSSPDLIAKGVADENFRDTYRLFAFTKGTKTFRAVRMLLEAGDYEDSLILCRAITECYLSQRYLNENFGADTFKNMMMIPVGLNFGALAYDCGVLKSKTDGEEFEYNVVSPDRMPIGKDKRYYYYLYTYLCELAHCNVSQMPGYAEMTQERKARLKLDSDFNVKPANVLPLFVFGKLFENVVLHETTQFETAEEEQDAVQLLTELTEFLYCQLREMYNTLKNDSITPNHSMFHIAHESMASLKEQLGRVDKTFVTALEKKFTKK